jgi:proton glutamate symport protein
LISKSGPAPADGERQPFAVSPWITVAALLLGLGAGMATGIYEPQARVVAIATLGTIGGLWLDALKMVVIPLMVALLINGIVGSARIASEGRLAARALAWFMGLYVLSALIGAASMPFLLGAFPLSPSAAEAIRAGFAAVDPGTVQNSVAGVSDFVRSFIPPNLFAAAAKDSILPVIFFTFVFAVALTRLEPARRQPVVAFFDSIGAAMLVIIRWVLALAPIGVFALAFVAGAASGTGLFGGLLQFIVLYIAIGLILLALAYLLALTVARLPLRAFSRAMAPTQAIAFSTQSSTGSLPAMLVSARKLGIGDRSVDIVLPLAAALFRVTGPAMNIAVVIFVANVLGMNLGWSAFGAGVVVASFASISAPGLPGQVSYFTSIAPISMAMGVPIAPLGVLIAVEPIPDMFRTLSNVTMDVAVAGVVDRSPESAL